MTPTLSPAFVLRPFVEGDRPYVTKTWLVRTWVSRERGRTTLPKGTYFSLGRAKLKALVAANPPVIVALAEDPSVIVGFGLLDAGKPFIHVASSFRDPKYGIAAALNQVR